MDNVNFILLVLIFAALFWWISIHAWEMRKIAKEEAEEEKNRIARQKRVRQLTNRT